MIIERILELLTGKEGAEALVKKLIAASEDFAEGHQQFEAAINSFRDQLSTDVSPSVDDLIDSIDEQITSLLLFAGYLVSRQILTISKIHLLVHLSRRILKFIFEKWLQK